MSTPHPHLLKNCLAPAKLNIFLHIIGRRDDGYHLLQSVFQLIDLCDELDFEFCENKVIHRVTNVPNVPEERDLVVRAAQLLQTHTQTPWGVHIHLRKRIPIGGGLGGGSSDAATTLLALNKLWNCGLSRSELSELGLQLGADVPFFLCGGNAFVEGIGEKIQALPHFSANQATATAYSLSSAIKPFYLLVAPQVHVPTPLIFSAKSLTRNSVPVTIADFSDREKYQQKTWKNDLQATACELFTDIQKALDWLDVLPQNWGGSQAMMTGSGSCVFSGFSSEESVRLALQHFQTTAPHQWRAWVVKSLAQHPLSNFC